MSYDHDALWEKARVFVNRAMDSEKESGRSFDERAMWAALALELLGKAALARHSPLLIAIPNEEGVALLAASGLVEGGATTLQTVQAKTIYSRCGRAFKPFNREEALKLNAARNEYLHGPDASFGGLPEAVFWARFWALASVLITAQDREIVDFVGRERVVAVEAHLRLNEENVAHRAETLVQRAKQRLDQLKSGVVQERVARSMKHVTHDLVSSTYREPFPCPACRADGQVGGVEVASFEIKYEGTSEEDFESWVEVQVYPHVFTCRRCKLHVDDFDVLDHLGVGLFASIGDAEDFYEGEYGND